MTTDTVAAGAPAAKAPRVARIPAAKVTVLPDGLKPGDVRVSDVDGGRVLVEFQWTSKASPKTITRQHEDSLRIELIRREAARKAARKSA